MTPRALGGGLAAAREEVYVRCYADTREAVRVHAHELLVASMERARGYEDSAQRRETGAAKLLRTHTNGLYEQHGTQVARAWLDRAKAEASAPPAPPDPALSCEAPAPKPAPRKRAPRVPGETRAERSARNKAAWAARPRGKAAK